MPYALDLIVVTVFVLIGRATHEDGFAVDGTLQTLWPFVVALLAGWAAGPPRVATDRHTAASCCAAGRRPPDRALG